VLSEIDFTQSDAITHKPTIAHLTSACSFAQISTMWAILPRGFILFLMSEADVILTIPEAPRPG